MKKDLPEMYHNNINKNINNNSCIFSSLIDKKVEQKDNLNLKSKTIKKDDWFTIEQKIFNIFNAKDYIYKADVTIVTDEQTIKKRIVGKNANNLITIDNEYIPISIIQDIYKS